MANDMQLIEEGAAIEFISEHYWGYAKKNEKETNEYEVIHPKWQYYPVKEYTIDVDFGINYGKDFELLNTTKPNSVMVLEGSEISVENKTILL